MLMWRIGPFARSTENRRSLAVQRERCEQLHREGTDSFFADPARETLRGTLAKVIVLDQYPRGVYRGTLTAYAYDAITGPLSCQVCDREWDVRDYGIVERMWGYMPFSHAESLALQERGVERFIKWSDDQVDKVAPERRMASLHENVPIAPDAPHSLMDVFEIAGSDTEDYPTLYRHVLLPDKSDAFKALCAAPLIVDPMDKVKAIILKDSSEPCPPRSAKHSVHPVIDVQALNAVVDGGAPPADA